MPPKFSTVKVPAVAYRKAHLAREILLERGGRILPPVLREAFRAAQIDASSYHRAKQIGLGVAVDLALILLLDAIQPEWRAAFEASIAAGAHDADDAPTE